MNQILCEKGADDDFLRGKRYNSWEKVDDMLISAISVALWLNIERKLKKCSLIVL